MGRNLVLAGLVLGVFSLGVLGLTPVGVRAEIGAMDVVPAATLLLPYFEVDLEGDGPNTIVTVRNADAAPALVQAAFYSDLAEGTLVFDFFMIGFGIERIDLRQLFEGERPGVSLGVDTETSGTARPEAENALFEDGFESGDLSAWSDRHERVSRQGLMAYHTGGVNARTGLTAGFPETDGIARGYIYFNNVNVRSLIFPNEPGYFVSGGLGVASNSNALTGEYQLIDGNNNFAVGNTLVHVEADGAALGPGDYTFFGALVNGLGADNRESLATEWRSRIINGGAFSSTEIVYWRDPKVAGFPRTPGTLPSWYPLSQAMLVVFDEQSNPAILEDVTPFGRASGRVGIGDDGLPSPFDFGWVYVDFNAVDGPFFSSISQGVMVSLLNSEGRFAVDLPGMGTLNAREALILEMMKED